MRPWHALKGMPWMHAVWKHESARGRWKRTSVDRANDRHNYNLYGIFA